MLNRYKKKVKIKKDSKYWLFPSPAALHLSKSGPAGFEKS